MSRWANRNNAPKLQRRNESFILPRERSFEA